MRLRHEIQIGKAYKVPATWYGNWNKGNNTYIEKDSIVLLLDINRSKNQWLGNSTLYDFKVLYNNHIVNFVEIDCREVNTLKLVA